MKCGSSSLCSTNERKKRQNDRKKRKKRKIERRIERKKDGKTGRKKGKKRKKERSLLTIIPEKAYIDILSVLLDRETKIFNY